MNKVRSTVNMMIKHLMAVDGYNVCCRNFDKMDTSRIRGRRPLSEVNGDASVAENGIMFLEERLMQHQVRRSLVLWRSPLRTLYYFVMETLVLLRIHGMRYVLVLVFDIYS